MTYSIDLDVSVTVEATGAVRGARGGPWEAPEPDEIELRVYLGTLEITEALPADTRAALEDDAFVRLYEAVRDP